MSDKTELLPCPFCSAKPELWSDSRRTWGLVQHKDGCLFPNIRKHEIPEEYFAAWNTRAERTCKAIKGKCSNCGKDLPEDPYSDYEGNFCPSCGARTRRMVGE